jgi:hypothetical protein
LGICYPHHLKPTSTYFILLETCYYKSPIVVIYLSKCEISISAAEELLPVSSRDEQTKIAIVTTIEKSTPTYQNK